LGEFLAFGRHAASLFAALCLCVIAGLSAFGLTRSRAALGPRIGTATLLGSAIWAAPFLTTDWQGGAVFNPLLLALSLACAVAASFLGMIAYSRAEGYLRMIGSGAILGGGAGFSHAAMLFAIHGAGEGVFDDAPLCAGVAIASALAVLAFVVLSRGRRHAVALAAISLAIGCTACAVLADSALTLAPTATAALASDAIPAGAMAFFAPTLVATLLAGAVWLQRPGLKAATRAPAWRESPQPARAPSRAETTFPRPMPGRSAAVQAAVLARQVRRAR
jgi:NO-binding membrane sensor protein with MHYT domain